MLDGRQCLQHDACQGDEGNQLGGTGHEARHLRGRALVDIRHPHVEWHGANLEEQADQHERRAQRDDRVVRAALGQRCGNAAVHERARRAIEERSAVDEDNRADRAEHEVLEARLERGTALAVEGAEHVQRQREELEADEQRDERRRAGDDAHARADEQQQCRELGAVLAEARPADRQQNHQRGHDRHGDAHELGEVVDAEGAGHRDDGRAAPSGHRESDGDRQRTQADDDAESALVRTGEGG